LLDRIPQEKGNHQRNRNSQRCQLQLAPVHALTPQ
jgi:hypothetical protein